MRGLAPQHEHRPAATSGVPWLHLTGSSGHAEHSVRRRLKARSRTWCAVGSTGPGGAAGEAPACPRARRGQRRLSGSSDLIQRAGRRSRVGRRGLLEEAARTGPVPPTSRARPLNATLARMDLQLAEAIADSYERWSATGDPSVKALISPGFYDNVSGQRGLMIFDVVGRWLDESFADRRIDHHATMVDGDRVMVWYTRYGRHIGNGFPRMRGHAVTGAQVSWPQLHVFRVQDGKVV